MLITLSVVGIISVFIILNAVKIVPQQEAWVVEKLGKFDKVLEPGLSVIIPIIQRIAYKHTLKEEALDVKAQTAISNDNVSLSIDGVLYVKIIDPVSASYGVSNPYYAISQLAQTNMRSEIGKLTLDRTFEEREALNHAIVTSINQAATNWGIQCMRYEIKDIQPPKSILQAMELQVAAERKKRAVVLESEGIRESKINTAEGDKVSVVLSSEAAYTDWVNRSKGQSESIAMLANATAASIESVASAFMQNGSAEAVAFKIAEQYINAFSNIAKESSTIILPADLNNPGAFVSQIFTIFEKIVNQKKHDN
ncbi:SPFH domain-containing protein [Rickettsia endosymbiont of Cardiosporidium cionae]|uniref:SPFH domain-containing protein n=1 Tax=Rickettsia endosymbiont of Cardiosporidium cionae TaxID=2777155 RepID=UPI001893A9F3|nr:stomatin-like protein [Rickettsia endosymbiont of Cardiosporidium cionae]KAF8818230.1 paraslipin [Rickettsia endosymbiont of Cardiosporidium cionae]